MALLRDMEPWKRRGLNRKIKKIVNRVTIKVLALAEKGTR